MTVSHTLNQGLAACTLRDHPMAKTWAEKPQAFIEAWLNRLDAKGYWHESGHYGRVSVSKIMLFAVALQRAGFKDYFQDQRMKNLALFYEKSLTPLDRKRPSRSPALRLRRSSVASHPPSGAARMAATGDWGD